LSNALSDLNPMFTG